MDLYIGLMSGTSADAIDAVMVDFSASPLKVIATHSVAISPALHNSIVQLYSPDNNEIDRMGSLDRELGEAFAKAVFDLIQTTSVNRNQIKAIGCHGQTIRHRPHPSQGKAFTMQIGDPNCIAEMTGITTVADFRRRDMVLGGEGAPLVPAFHQWLFSNPEADRAIVNIGGIANVSWLFKDGTTTGYDIGPGNGLMDAWVQKHKHVTCDLAGRWAAEGNINAGLVNKILAHPYFSRVPPKSTGREEFNISWLNGILESLGPLNPEDVQASLMDVTAKTIAQDLHKNPNCEIFMCGGGVFNTQLMLRLAQLLNVDSLNTTDVLGLPPTWVEAVAFAWLARQTMSGLTGNIPAVTGARRAVVLGGIYPGRA